MVFYRVKQVLWALTARPLTADDRVLVETTLSPAESELFYRYSLNDQNHAVRVVKHLAKNNHIHPALLKAALLHDVGKTKVGRLSVIDRSVAVAIKALLPKRSKAWGKIDLEAATRFQKPSIVRAQHAKWGAQMAQSADSDPLTIWLIHKHQSKINEIVTNDDQLLVHLQTADNLC